MPGYKLALVSLDSFLKKRGKASTVAVIVRVAIL